MNSLHMFVILVWTTSLLETAQTPDMTSLYDIFGLFMFVILVLTTSNLETAQAPDMTILL